MVIYFNPTQNYGSRAIKLVGYFFYGLWFLKVQTKIFFINKTVMENRRRGEFTCRFSPSEQIALGHRRRRDLLGIHGFLCLRLLPFGICGCILLFPQGK